jgi:hypothetical protein
MNSDDQNSRDALKAAGLRISMHQVAKLALDYVGDAGDYDEQIARWALNLTIALQYIACEVIKLAGNEERKGRTIHPRHIMLAIRKDKDLDEVFPGVFSFCGVVPKTEKPLVEALLNDDDEVSDEDDDEDDDKILTICQAKKLFRELPDDIKDDEDKANLWGAMILRLCAKASIVKARTSALDTLRDASKYFLGKVLWFYGDACGGPRRRAHQIASLFPSKVVTYNSNVYGKRYWQTGYLFVE